MQPYRISVLGDCFLFFSLPSDAEIPKALACGERCVILLPSVECDFCLTGYEPSGKPLYDYCSAALCAAAHLTKTCGLPFSEIRFETPTGILEIICTGDGFFTERIDKCKLLLSKNIEVFGCEPDVSDVFVNGIFRVMRLYDSASFDKKAFRRLVSVELPLPCAVVLSAMEKDVLSVRTYADYNPTPPSSVLAHAAAAYRECASSKFDLRGLSLSFGNSAFCRARYSDVSITVKPTLVT